MQNVRASGPAPGLEPAVIDWPKLDEQTRDRLVGLPIWDIAVQTEGQARLNVASYAAQTREEEARHILFFVNWAAWHRRTMPLWRRPFFELKVLAVWIFLVWERIGIARNVGTGAEDNNFTLTGAKSVGDDIDAAELIDICLAENNRRMSLYDPRLLRPFAVPALAGFARRFIKPAAKRPA